MAKQISSDKEVSPRPLFSSLGDLAGWGQTQLPLFLGLEAAEQLRQGSMGAAKDSGATPPLSSLWPSSSWEGVTLLQITLVAYVETTRMATDE